MNLGKEIGSAGKELGTVNVKVGPRFLNLFSQQLYSSPNKAFEELLSNSWDAGADTVYVRIPENLQLEDSTVWVLDNGSSMDADGLQALWNVAHSPKVTRVPLNGRKPIGKFGIGKLATYILCNELTYVCKYDDGVIRAVTMDYRRIDETAQDNDEISPDGLGLPLSVRELTTEELTALIKNHDNNKELIGLIQSGVPKIENSDFGAYEFGDGEIVNKIKPGTWTLVLLTSLKEAGTKLQVGRIKRILRVALPLGNSMVIKYNGEVLSSAKSDVGYTEWKFDKNFPITEFTAQLSEDTASVYKVTGFSEPYPHVKISGLSGELLGSIKIFERSIAGDNLKSEDMGYSNGFVINVLGRIINIDAPYFGLKNLQHTTWSQFRAAVRADWLDKYISVTREDVQEVDELAIFRAFLLACFNKARGLINSKEAAARDDIGKTLIKTFSALPLEPLHRTVSSKAFGSERPNFITVDSSTNPDKVLDDWDKLPRKDFGQIIERVTLDDNSADNDPIYKYDLTKRSLLINSQHPFVKEHSSTREQKELLQDSLLAEMLTDSFIADLGLGSGIVDEISNYRELVFRLIAKISRRTGGQIADLIDSATQQSVALEQIVGDALEFLGFSVKRMAKPGEPEGVATAILPAKTFKDNDTKIESDIPTVYSFTYDAKSTSHSKASTNNINIANIAKHRKDNRANFTLVVAPDFQDGQLAELCKTSLVTPMRARDLKKLLIVSATSGPVDLYKFKEVFSLFSPDEVRNWVENFCNHMTQPKLTLGMLLDLLVSIGHDGPDAVSTKVIAYEARRQYPALKEINFRDVSAILSGLQVLFPKLVTIESDKVYLSTTPSQIRQEILSQIKDSPSL